MSGACPAIPGYTEHWRSIAFWGHVIQQPAFYRTRAHDMRRQAETAASEDLRNAYLDIAREWQRMADAAEAHHKGPKKTQE